MIVFGCRFNRSNQHMQRMAAFGRQADAQIARISGIRMAGFGQKPTQSMRFVS